MRTSWQTVIRSATVLKATIFITALLIGVVAPILTTPITTHADTTCGTAGVALYGTDSSWLNGAAVNVCNHPGDNSNVCVPVAGAPADPTHGCAAGNVWSGTAWQCVEMVNRLYLTKGWTTTTWTGDGGGTNGLAHHVPGGLTAESQGAISYLNPGDVISLDYTGDPAGHAGIINTVSSTIAIVNQNAQLNSSAYISAGSLSGHNASLHMNAWAGYTVQAIVHHPSGNPSYPDGTFLQVNQTGNVYEVVGGAPLYVSSWANVGGQHPTTWVDQSFINGLRPYPSDNTFVQAFPSGKVYVFAGGAPLYVSDWSRVGGVHTVVNVDDAPIVNHLNTLAYPLDNTFVQAFPSGKVYVFAGGAPLYVSSWANVGGVHSTVTVDDMPIDNHLNTRAYPLDGTYVQAFPSGKVYVFAGGAPLYVYSWSNVGGVHTTVAIDDAPITNHWNTLAYPVDGTYVKGYGSGEEFLAMSGAVTRVTTTPLPPATIVDDWAIVNQLGGTL